MNNSKRIYHPEFLKYLIQSIANLWIILLIGAIYISLIQLISITADPSVGVSKGVIIALLAGCASLLVRRLLSYKRISYYINDDSIVIKKWFSTKKIAKSDLFSIECKRSWIDRNLNLGRIIIHTEDPSKIIYDGTPQTFIKLESIKEYEEFLSLFKK